ncbi:hypothetical protein FJZ36_14090 [Candidatus Poribacteria bacterium]|nr:hypothetical protein [Candidatus Poribacteria bacterium]
MTHHPRLARRIATALFVMASLHAAAEMADMPFVGQHSTAYPLGRGGFVVGAGFVPYDRQLPRPGRPAMRAQMNIGGVEIERQTQYIGDGAFLPARLGFAVGDATDLYLTATTGSGTSEKRIDNFYGVPDDDYRSDIQRYTRVYDQPVFDFGIDLRSQLKPDLGDGLPAVAVEVGGRFGYTADDHGEFQDTTPDSGFLDVGGTASLLASQRFGPYLRAHAAAGIVATQKLGTELVYGAAGEFSIIPDQMSVVADYRTRRDIAGSSFSKTKEVLGVGVQYYLGATAVAQLTSSLHGSVYLSLTRVGARAETIAPQAPTVDGGLF